MHWKHCSVGLRWSERQFINPKFSEALAPPRRRTLCSSVQHVSYKPYSDLPVEKHLPSSNTILYVPCHSMALDGCSGGLRTTQEIAKGYSIPFFPNYPAEPLHCSPDCGVHILKETHVYNSVPASPRQRSAPHVVNNSAQQEITTLSHTGPFLGNAQSSSISDVTSYEPHHNRQMEENSEVAPEYLRAFTTAAPSHSQQSSRWLPSASSSLAAEQLQNETGCSLSQWGWPAGIVSSRPEPSSSHTHAPHHLLRSIQALVSTNAAASGVNPLSAPPDTVRRERTTSSLTGEPPTQTSLWFDDGTAPQHVLSKGFVAESTRNPVMRNDIWNTHFQLASQENCCPHLDDCNNTKFAPGVEGEKYRDAAGCPSQDVISPASCSPVPCTCCTSNIDVEDARNRRNRQTPATVLSKGVELENSTMQNWQRSNNDKTATLLEVLPLTSPLPPQGCAVPWDNRDAQEATGILGVCCSAVETKSEAGKCIHQAQEPAVKTEQQCQSAREKQKVEDTANALARRQKSSNYCCSTADTESWGVPRKEDGAIPITEHHLNKTERISAFVAALHSFLASGELLDELDSQLTVKNVADEVSLHRHSDHRDEHHELAVAKPGLCRPEIVPVVASRDAARSCNTHSTDERTEIFRQSTKTNDAALVAFESTGDPLGCPIYPSSTCSERTSYCSGITAMGSEMSSHGGTSIDQSTSYTSCSSFGAGGYSTLATIMQGSSGALEHTETDKKQSAACCSLQEPSRTLPTSYTENVTTGLAPHQRNYAVQAAAAATPTTGTIKTDYAKLSPGTSRFQKLVRAFYADNSRHSVLWDESQEVFPLYSFSAPAQSQLSVQREKWTAASGIMEVMLQVKALVKRLRGLQLVTRELAAIPDASGALCCCLSGDLKAYATVADRTAQREPIKWKFEQLLVLSIQDDGSADAVQQMRDELSAVRNDGMPEESRMALHGFQIQDEVFMVSPAHGSQTHFTKVVPTASPTESIGPQRSSDASSEESSYRCPAERGWKALLKWEGQGGVGEWATVSSSGQSNQRNALLSSCPDVKASISRQLLQSTCAAAEGTPAGNGRNVFSATTIQKNGDETVEEYTGRDFPSTPLGQHARQEAAIEKNSIFSSQPQQHRIDRLCADNAALKLWPATRGGDLERNVGRTILKSLARHQGSATGVTCQAVSNQLEGLPSATYGGQLTNPHSDDELQLCSEKRYPEFTHPCLASGGIQHDHASAHSAPKNRSETGSSRAALPVLATAPEAATISRKQLMNALLQCLQDFHVTDDTGFKVERCSLATASNLAGMAATYANLKVHPSLRTHKDDCKLQLTEALVEGEPSPAGGIRDNAEAAMKTIFKQPTPIKWGAEDPSGKPPPSAGTGDTGKTKQKGSTSGKQGDKKRNWGGERLEILASGDCALRRRSPRADAKGKKERLESARDTEENLQTLGFFRERCTVFVSWVPRAARADDIKQKTSMEMRLKVLLQMAMGVRGIVRVALFPPRGSHCCVLFGSPAAASAFIQEYGGPTYTSSTEQFKADICAAYAVALDRGIERVFIRIEEFKPHVLQQHLLQQGRDRATSAAREWQERPRDCVAAPHDAPGRWRRHQIAALREKGRKNANYHSSTSSVQPFRDSVSSHDLHSKDTVKGQASSSVRPWQTHEMNSESCSVRRPLFRQYVSQQLPENLHQGHRPHHQNR